YHLQQILDLELKAVQDRIMKGTAQKFIFQCTPEAKKFLLDEGIDYKYGARHLKRAIERFLVYPPSNLGATEQLGMGDLVIIEFDTGGDKLLFSKEVGGALVHPAAGEYAEHFTETESGQTTRTKAHSAKGSETEP